VNADWFGLQAKTVIVIGTGLGEEQDGRLARTPTGADLVLIDNVAERVERVAGTVRGMGHRAEAQIADVL
jgi:hypothetical protein